MLTYPTVEDYLEYLAGYEVGITALIMPSTPKISLARYDIQIVNSMANTTAFGTALTDRQAELAVKLVLKYRRQFAKQGIDVAPVETPVFRMPPRKMDRTKTIWLADEQIHVKFPYDNLLIKDIQTFREESQGRAHYDRDSKVWHLALTEYNVNWIVPWGNANGFEVDNGVREIFYQILECEQQPFEIKLVQQGNAYAITNAANSLIEYINTHAGGFGQDNLIKLIDHAGLCGYTIDDAINIPSLSLRYIGSKHTIHLEPSATNLNMIFDYAEITNRYPICIYNPTLLDMDLSRFKEEEIVYFDRNGKTKTSDYNPYDVKVVYAQKIPATWDFPVPLMVTTFEMMFGGKRMSWTNRAEKIIYYCTTQLRENN
jgi:hypothetical protein